MKSAIASTVFLSFSIAILRCGMLPNYAGDTSETGNTYVLGKVYGTSGYEAPNTQVTIIPAAYDPVKDASVPDSMIDTTDESGNYMFAVKTPGRYFLSAVQLEQRTRALVTSGITVAKDVDTIRVIESVLQIPGVLKVILPDAIDQVNGYLYIPGTTLRARVTGGTAILDSVPAGFIPAVDYVNPADSTKSRVIKTDFTVAQSATTVISEYSAWGHSTRIYLNTTSTGVDVSATVTNFPVLVRLNSTNFSFTQSKPDGSDLRAAKADSTPLPFEIERWDAGAMAAEIWVRVDTLYGNDSTQFITMYWGNPAASGASNSAAVFDTGAGFQGVWHLGQQTAAHAKDATVHHYDGTPSATPPTLISGMIGGAQEFNGSSNYFTMINTSSGALDFPYQGTYSISAWAYTEILDSNYHTIVNKGSFNYNLEVNKQNKWQCADYKTMVGWEVVDAPAYVKQWVYLTGVRKGTSLYIYINGTLADTTIEIVPRDQIPRNNSQDVTIGRMVWLPEAEGPYFYDGGIDEVRIANVALSADWIKLCYMNQKADDKLVVIKY